MQTLPVDIIVSILSQDNQLLGTAHYLSKSIAKKARPIQLKKLIHNPPSTSEIPLITERASKGYCVRESPRPDITHYACYSVCTIGHAQNKFTLVTNDLYGMYDTEDAMFPGARDKTGTYFCLPFRSDLYAAKAIFHRRGGDASALVRRMLEELLFRTKTVADVIAIHAFLSMHMVILSHDIPTFEWGIDVKFNDPGLCAHPVILQQVGEWYDIVQSSLV